MYVTIPITLCLTFCAARYVVSDSARYEQVTSVEKKKIQRLDSVAHARQVIEQEKLRALDSIKLQNIRPLISKVKVDINRSKANFLKFNSYYGSVLVTDIFPLSLFPYFCGKCVKQDSAVYMGDTVLIMYNKQYIQYVVIPLVSYIQPKVGFAPYKSYRLITYFKNPSTGEWVAEDTCLSRLELTDTKEGYYGCK
jgi:hypothetical protein